MVKSIVTPFRDLLPPLSTEELSALKQRILDEGGIHDPVLISEAGEVLDGHNRIEIDPNAKTKVIPGLSEAEKKAFVFRSNWSRRNLSPEQKTELRKAMKKVAAELREEDPNKWTQEAVGKALGVDQTTVSRWFEKTTPNMKEHNRCIPDARVKLPSEAKTQIVERVEAGEVQAQVAADFGVSQQHVGRVVTKAKKQTKKKADDLEASKKIAENSTEVILGDFIEKSKTIPNNSIALIFTDPPYDRKSLPFFKDLSEIGDRVLIDGGSLVTFCGQYVLDAVIQNLSESLKYFWIGACVHSGKIAQMREYGIKVKWKPLLWFVKGDFRRDRETWVEDIVLSKEEKSDHPWQQSIIEARHFIEKLTAKNEVVLDPFCGSGTTAIAAKQLNRRWITYEKDQATYTRACERIHQS